jgi:hypothetical protein
MWNSLNPEYLGPLSHFDDVMKEIGLKEPSLLPDLSPSRTLIVASDFGGDHEGSPYSTLSFVIASAEAVAHRDLHRRRLRDEFKLGRRRIAFSKLTDRRKRAACLPFLYLANAMSGLAVTILIDKRIESLFVKHGVLTQAEMIIAGRQFVAWKPLAFERVLRSAYLVAVFVAGLSAPMQDIIWVTDEDAIAPNVPRLTELTYIFAHVLSAMLSHDVRHIRVGTTGTTAGDDLRIEDYAAIADLLAGSMSDYIASYAKVWATLSSVITLAPADLPRKTKSLVAMLFDERAPLRKLVFAIDSVPGSDQLNVKRIRVHLEPFIVVE